MEGMLLEKTEPLNGGQLMDAIVAMGIPCHYSKQCSDKAAVWIHTVYSEKPSIHRYVCRVHLKAYYNGEIEF